MVENSGRSGRSECLAVRLDCSKPSDLHPRQNTSKSLFVLFLKRDKFDTMNWRVCLFVFWQSDSCVLIDGKSTSQSLIEDILDELRDILLASSSSSSS